MAINQGDVYLLPHAISQRKDEKPPFIVLSANYHERTFVAVMMTSSKITYDIFSFDLSDSMFDSILERDNCHIRMHLLTLCLDEQIIGKKVNRMKEFYFNQLMKTIGEMVFNFNFEPLP